MANRGGSDDAGSTSTPGAPGQGSSRRDVLRGALAGGVILASGGLAAACGGSSPSGSATPTPTGPAPRRGGNLRVGILGGSTSDTLDAHKEVVQPDALRVMALYNPLVRLNTKARLHARIPHDGRPPGHFRTHSATGRERLRPRSSRRSCRTVHHRATRSYRHSSRAHLHDVPLPIDWRGLALRVGNPLWIRPPAAREIRRSTRFLLQ